MDKFITIGIGGSGGDTPLGGAGGPYGNTRSRKGQQPGAGGGGGSASGGDNRYEEGAPGANGMIKITFV